jgi:hypothetical protein
MTDFPAIMSAPMIRAILREVREPGTGKTMTRRLAWRLARKGEATGEGSRLSYEVPEGSVVGNVTKHERPSPWQRVKRGDRIWIRENALYWINNVGPDVNKRSKVAAFAADGYELESGERWTPSIHMERRFSRLTLRITNTKIERLQDITETDALAEGIRETAFYCEDHPASICFSVLWDSLHSADSWDANPFVVAVSFRPVLANIDSLEIAA